VRHLVKVCWPRQAPRYGATEGSTFGVKISTNLTIDARKRDIIRIS